MIQSAVPLSSAEHVSAVSPPFLAMNPFLPPLILTWLAPQPRSSHRYSCFGRRYLSGDCTLPLEPPTGWVLVSFPHLPFLAVIKAPFPLNKLIAQKPQIAQSPTNTPAVARPGRAVAGRCKLCVVPTPVIGNVYLYYNTLTSLIWCKTLVCLFQVKI